MTEKPEAIIVNGRRFNSPQEFLDAFIKETDEYLRRKKCT